MGVGHSGHYECLQWCRTTGRPGGGRPLCSPPVAMGVFVPGSALPIVMWTTRNSEPVWGPSRQPARPAPLLPCNLAIHSAVKSAQLALEGMRDGALVGGGTILWHQWYLDDGAFLGPADAVEALLGGLLPALGRLGCSANRTKCQVWGPGVPHMGGGLPILSSFHHLDWREDGLTMLGVPICRPGDSGSARLALTAGVGGGVRSLPVCHRPPTRSPDPVAVAPHLPRCVPPQSRLPGG